MVEDHQRSAANREIGTSLDPPDYLRNSPMDTAGRGLGGPGRTPDLDPRGLHQAREEGFCWSGLSLLGRGIAFSPSMTEFERTEERRAIHPAG